MTKNITTTTQRSIYLDVLKVIAITLVCGYHFSWVGPLPYSSHMTILDIARRFIWGIGSICMPLFFMVNGALLLNQDFHFKKHMKKIGRIWGQHIIWRALTILSLAYFTEQVSTIYLTDFINACIFQNDMPHIDLHHFWFIPTLISVYLLFPFIKKVYDGFEIKENRYLLFSLLSFLCLFSILLDDFVIIKTNIPYIKNIIPYSLQNFNPFGTLSGALLVYFILGGLIHKYREKIHKISYIPLFLLFTAGLLLAYLEWWMISSSNQSAWDNIFGGYTKTPALLMSVSIYMIVYKLCHLKQNCRFFDFVKHLSQNTMNIFYLHWILGYTLLGYMKIGPDGIIMNLIKALVMIIVCTFIAEIGKKIPLIRRIFY